MLSQTAGVILSASLLFSSGKNIDSAFVDPIVNTRYVCNQAQPGCSYVGTQGIMDAITDSIEGDTVILETGVYENTAIKIGIPDTKKITIRGEGNRESILDGSGLSTVFEITNNSEINLENLIIKNGKYWGVFVSGGSTVKLDNVTVSVNGLSNIATTNKAHIEFINSTSSLSADYGIDITSDSSAVIASSKIFQNNTGIRVSNTGALRSTTISGNKIYDNTSAGIYVPDSPEVQISGNDINTNYTGLIINDPSKIRVISNRITQNTFDGIAILPRTGNFKQESVILGNKILNNGKSGIVIHSNALSISAEHTYSIHANVLAYNQANGLFLGAQADNSNVYFEIVNNTSAKNKGDGFFVADTGKNLKSNLVVNNIAVFNYSGRGFKIDNTNFDFSYNVSFKNMIPFEVQKFDVDLIYTFNPQFINSNGDYHLGSTSPARNMGAPNVLNPNGSRSDMGAYGGPNACYLDPFLTGCM